MSTNSDRRRPPDDGRGGPVGFVLRQPLYAVLVLVVALGAGTMMALSTRGSSHAATIHPAARKPHTVVHAATPSTGGVSWKPGNIEQIGSPGGDSCSVQMTSSNFSASDASTESKVSDALGNESQNDEQSVNKDGINTLNFDVGSGQGTSTEIDPASSIDCSLLSNDGKGGNAAAPSTNGADYRTGSATRGETVVFSRDGATLYRHGIAVAAYHADLHQAGVGPKWFRGAFAAVVGAIVFTAVSVVTVAAMVALGAATGPGGVLASPALAALAGCIGGSISTAVTIALATNGGVAGTVASGVAGCLTGSLIGSIPANQVGAWIGNGIRGLGGSGVVGGAAEAAGAGAGVQLTPVQQAMQDAISGLGHV